MAQKRRSRKSRKKYDPIDQILTVAARPEVLGLVLVLLAVFTLLSLLTSTRGAITGQWIDLLEQLFGMGKWGVPLVTGALGLWVVIRAIDRMPNLPWQTPAGSGILFVAYITAATLLFRSDPASSGGAVGLFLATNLENALGLWGAWSFVTILVITAIVLLTDRLLLDLAQETSALLQDWWDHRRLAPVRMPTIRPALPIPSGEIPWWKRLTERLPRRQPQPTLPPNMVAPQAPVHAIKPPSTLIQAQAQPLAGASPVPAAQRLARTTPMRPDADILTPRIVGGAQEWRLPRISDMLENWERSADSDDLIRKQGRLIQETLALFGVPADFEGAYKGPSVTQYLIKPGYTERNTRGETQRVKVKVSKIAGLSNDLALALAAPSVRIEAPIPGTNYVGVEVPNSEPNKVGLKELMESEAFQSMKGKLRIALGEDVKGQPIVADLARMPHLLIAGATGSGKSVCINSIITCLLLTHTPDTLRMLMVDPKMVELSVYNGIPHLLSPVVTEVDRAAGVLFWAVKEMERRYQLCSKANCRDLERYNSYLVKRNEKPLPFIVVVVDEMADLMMAAPEDVEKHICRLAQMARAVGIHVIIATQRPSVDVITGLIKANFPSRIAFAVSSQIDSRVILDEPGAERLLGRGDMLFRPPDASRLERVQGTFLNDDEISRSVRYWKGIRSLDGIVTPTAEDVIVPGDDQDLPDLANLARTLPKSQPFAEGISQPMLFAEIEQMKAHDARDELFDEAVEIVKSSGRGSVSLLQRKLRIGYSRASRLVDQLEEAGIVGADQGGNQGRPVLINTDEPPKAQPSASSTPPPRIIGGSGDEDQEPPARPRVWM
ncbi:MAG: DNA translocase FtsK [Caldilineaceae bacterium]|nr:DNA translocase FtsK [Caldilineaceae bacterium]